MELLIAFGICFVGEIVGGIFGEIGSKAGLILGGDRSTPVCDA